jgi:hypothetical protein
MLHIPDQVWAAVLTEFSRERSDVERVAYLDGFRLARNAPTDDGHESVATTVGVATTVVVPNARLRPLSFQVSAADMAAAGELLRERGMTRLAQVHTHADDWVGHSPTDDACAYSQRVGSLSIVLPNHARSIDGLDGVGVHVRDRGAWRQLSNAEVLAAIAFVPSLIDLREKTCQSSVPAMPATRAGGSARRRMRLRVPFLSKFRPTSEDG